MCSGLARSSCSPTNGTYPWLFAVYIFRNGYPSHDGYHKAFEAMDYYNLTISSVTSFLAADLYQGDIEKNRKLWNIVATERYVLHMLVLLECCDI